MRAVFVGQSCVSRLAIKLGILKENKANLVLYTSNICVTITLAVKLLSNVLLHTDSDKGQYIFASRRAFSDSSISTTSHAYTLLV